MRSQSKGLYQQKGKKMPTNEKHKLVFKSTALNIIKSLNINEKITTGTEKALTTCITNLVTIKIQAAVPR